MISIFTVDQAKKSILNRASFNRDVYSQMTIKRTEDLFGMGVSPPDAVAQIIKSIDENGDAALRKWSKLLDNYIDDQFAVDPSEYKKAYAKLPTDTQQILQQSAQRIRTYHEHQPITSWITEEMGGQLGQRFTPIERIGVYVPGGTAPLPSSLLMSVIPALVAGVKQIIVCTPPKPHNSILAAAHICNITELYQIGGAQAIAAMAIGTETVPRVDKIVGAGNLFVTLAKKQLYGVVGLDGLAGPTETMIIADNSANPEWVAADLLAQAEHDTNASAILLTDDEKLAGQVILELNIQIKKLSRKEIIKDSLEYKGGIVITKSIDQAVELANSYAPEHLCLSVSKPKAMMERINNAGGFFLGDHSFEVLGDYIAGPSHIMPTGGTARFASPLSVLDFVKMSSVIALDPDTSAILSPKSAVFAELEKLTAHAAAAKLREEKVR